MSNRVTKKEFIEKMTKVLDELNSRGDFYTGQLHEDGSLFTIVSSWEAWHTWITNAALYSGCYQYYETALQYRIDKGEIKYVWTISENGDFVQVPALDDTRLGRNKRFPYDDEVWYQVPEKFQKYEEWADKLVGDWGFDDEYSTCDMCNKVIRTAPDSYSWTPDWLETPNGERVHIDCLDLDGVVDIYRNKSRKAIPDGIADRLVDAGKLVQLDQRWENGFYNGQDDDPKKVRAAFKQAGIDSWFTYSVGQFDTAFWVLVLPEDEERANKLVELGIDAYQGWSTANELSKAMRGEHSDHYHVETYLVSQEDLLAGKLPHPTPEPKEDEEDED